MKRRQFLALSSAGAVAAAGHGLSPRTATGREPIRRNGPPRFQVGLAAYSLRDYFSYMKGKEKTPASDGAPIDMFGFLDYCVEQGFDSAEPTSYFFPPDADENHFRELKRAAFVRGVTIAGTAIGNSFTVGRGPKLDAEIEDAKRWIDRAVWMGAPHIRFFAGTAAQLAQSPDRIDEAIEAIENCAEYAAERGVFIGIENHGRLNSDQMLRIMDRVQNRWVGINLDSGNFHSDDPYRDLERCVPYAVNVQVKVNMRTPEGKEEPADLPRIARILKSAGYQGHVILEYEDKNPYERIPQAHAALRKALGSA